MATLDNFRTFNQLLDRCLRDFVEDKRIVFVLGSAITAVDVPGGYGVSPITEILETVTSELSSTGTSNCDKEDDIVEKFLCLMNQADIELGQQRINEIFRRKILNARFDKQGLQEIKLDEITKIRELESEVSQWYLNRSVDSLGKIISWYSKLNKKIPLILTSNFDPLFEIGVKKNANINPVRFDLASNTFFSNIESEGPNILHFHGYWTGNMLVTPYGLRKKRERLKNDLNEVINANTSLVVLGYGGWDDIFTRLIFNEILEQINLKTDILWAFFSDDQNKILNDHKQLIEKISKERESKIHTYKGIDCHKFFYALMEGIETKVLEACLANYCISKKGEFENENGPEALLVQEIEYLTGDIHARKETKSYESTESFIQSEISEKSVIITANYGMGKTKIAKDIFNSSFKKDEEYPVFIHLAGINFNNYSEEMLVQKIYAEISKYYNGSLDDRQIVSQKGIIRRFLGEKKIVLIFDSIDGAVSSAENLRSFVRSINEYKSKIIITTRKEFKAIEDMKDLFAAYHVIEIKNWERKQWGEFAGLLEKKYPGQKEQVKKFLSDIIDGKYGELAERPIFIKLLAEMLFSGKGGHEKIKLPDNKAELYYEFLKWKIEIGYSDYTSRKENENSQTKSSDKEEEVTFITEAFELLRNMSVYEFETDKLKRELSKSGSTKYDDIFFGVNVAYLFYLCRRNKVLNPDVLISLLGNDFFYFQPILKKVQDNYDFSHRSFSEYLIANATAWSIFKGKINEAECGDAWNIYQDYVINNHFENEINRIWHGGSKTRRNKFLSVAFNRELLNLKMEQYSERIEQVIYYIGKYHVKNAQIKKKLKTLVRKEKKYKEIVNLKYRRTSFITLSKIENVKHMYDYLWELIDDFRRERKRIDCHVKEDKDYFITRQNLAQVCQKAVNLYLDSSRGLDSSMLLMKIFSNFTSLVYIDDELRRKEMNELLQKVIAKTIAENDIRGRHLLEGTKFLMNHLFYLKESKLLEQNLNEEITHKLESACKKRNDVMKISNAYRLINSSGDNLPGLIVDVYGTSAVIQFEREEIRELKDKIVEWLKSRINLENIFEKSTHWEITKGKEENIIQEVISGEDKTFMFEENGIKYISSRKLAKTGFFIDLREVRKYIYDYCKKNTGISILNTFSFTCSIGVCALKGGAGHVINVDKEKIYLEFGKRNYELNDIKFKENEFRKEEVNEYLADACDQKRMFDMVVLDPPELALIPQDLEKVSKIYEKLNKLALEVLNPGGLLITTCCSHGFPKVLFDEIISKTVLPHAEIEKIMPDLSDHPTSEIDPSLDYLKIYILKKNKN